VLDIEHQQGDTQMTIQNLEAFTTASEMQAMYAKLARAYRDAGRINDAVEQQGHARFWMQARLALMGMEAEIPGVN
jgi:hypothetical protein